MMDTKELRDWLLEEIASASTDYARKEILEAVLAKIWGSTFEVLRRGEHFTWIHGGGVICMKLEKNQYTHLNGPQQGQTFYCMNKHLVKKIKVEIKEKENGKL